MLDQLRERMAAYLAAHSIAVFYAGRQSGTGATVVRYRNDVLRVECLLPRWADAAYYLQETPRALLIVPTTDEHACWLQYTGDARIVAAPDWSTFAKHDSSPHSLHARYLIVELTPRRLDLFDQRHSWGARETLEL